MASAPGFESSVRQTALCVGAVTTAFLGGLGRLPLELLGLISAFLALIFLSVMIGLAWFRRGKDRSVSFVACGVPAVLLGAMSLFAFGLLPAPAQGGASAQDVAYEVRRTIDSVAGIQTPQPRNAAIIRPIAVASPQGNALGEALERALRARAPSMSSGAQTLEIAATVDGVYTNHAAGQYRGRAAVLLRVRESGLQCPLDLSHSGTVDAIARDFARDIEQQAKLMMQGDAQC
ncbi:MAG TPA: hypothetical protein PLK37_07565 [Terricaulis sp.]|nr:hypothetical protein [Terricaulis sp.]